MKYLSLFFFFLSVYMPAAMLGTEIVFWHGFEGFLYDKFAEIVEDFNHQSKDYRIRLVFKGNLTDVFEKGVAAVEERRDPPHILQVYEVATLTMFNKPEIYIPVDQLLSKYFKKFDPAVYIDAVRDFYSTEKGNMFSLPWNASTGILFYNKEIMQQVGLDPNKPPQTWEEMERYGEKLVNAGYNGFTTAWPAAYHLEHLCAWHNLPFATEENGFLGLSARLNFNGSIQIRHLQKLTDWQKSGIFSYQGRYTNEPEKLFTSGKCAILLQGSNRYPMLKKALNQPIGVGFMPYWSDVDGAPYRLNIGGSSFWVIAGFDEEAYRGIAQFFSYLSQPEIQAYWHQQTGYLPITEAAYYLSKKKRFYEQNPAAEIAVLEVMNDRISPNTKGIRLGNYPVVRNLIIDYLEKAFYGELAPKEALDRAIEEGNQLLAEFEHQHQVNN